MSVKLHTKYQKLFGEKVFNDPVTVKTLKISDAGSEFYTPVSGEPAGGDWHPVENPDTGWLDSKTAGWTADSFSGGLEVDFSAEVPVGTKAVRAFVRFNSSSTHVVYYRKSGDTNISNTPHASSEHSHQIGIVPVANGYWGAQVVLWLSSDYKIQIAVQNIAVDVLVAYPIEYMI